MPETQTTQASITDHYRTGDGEMLATVSPTLQTRLERSRDYIQRLIENRAPHRAEAEDGLYEAIRDLESRIQRGVTDEIAAGWEQIIIEQATNPIESQEITRKFSEASNTFETLWRFATNRTNNLTGGERQFRWNGGVVTLHRRNSTAGEPAVDAPSRREVMNSRYGRTSE